MNEEDEQISAGEALDRLESVLGGRAIAKATLAEKLRDDKLLARARHVFISGMDDPEDVWVSGLDDGLHVAYDLIVDHENWRDSIQWPADVGLWRWPEGQFFVTTRLKPLVRNYFDGVTFSLSDIVQLEAGGRGLEKSRSGGRRPDLQRWERFWMEVVQLAVDGNLVPGQIATQSALREDLISMMGENGLSEDSIKEPVRRIWARFFSV